MRLFHVDLIHIGNALHLLSPFLRHIRVCGFGSFAIDLQCGAGCWKGFVACGVVHTENAAQGFSRLIETERTKGMYSDCAFL